MPEASLFIEVTELSIVSFGWSFVEGLGTTTELVLGALMSDDILATSASELFREASSFSEAVEPRFLLLRLLTDSVEALVLVVGISVLETYN